MTKAYVGDELTTPRQDSVQSPELRLLRAVVNLLTYNLYITLIDAINVYYGYYGANPGWILASASPSLLSQPSAIIVAGSAETTNHPTVLAQTQADYDLRTFDQSVGASYNASGNATFTLNMGGQVYMGAQKPVAGSLEELESHFKRIDLSTFNRQISIQLTKNGGTCHVGTLEGCNAMKTMHFYRRGSRANLDEECDWERRLLWDLKCLEDARLSRISVQIYGICKTSFVTAVVYDGALVPLYTISQRRTWDSSNRLLPWHHWRLLVREKDVYAHKGLRETVLTNPKFQKEIGLSTWAKDHLHLQNLELYVHWEQHGFRYPHSVFVRLDTGQVIVADSVVEEMNCSAAGGLGPPAKLTSFSTIVDGCVPAEIPLAWQEGYYVWTINRDEDQTAAEHWREVALQHDPTLDEVIMLEDEC